MVIEPIEVSLGNGNCKYYEGLGYDIRKRMGTHGYLIPDLPQKIKVKFKDIPSQSNQTVTVICDICGKEMKRTVATENTALNKHNIDTCRVCFGYKINETRIKKYGTTNPYKICEQTGTQMSRGNKYNLDSLKEFADSKGYLLREDLCDCSSLNVNNHFMFECKKHKCTFNSSIWCLEISENCCPKCKSEEKSLRLSKSSIDQVKEICLLKDYELITDNIRNCDDTVHYICNKHRFAGIQNTSLYKLKYYNSNCRYCKMPSGSKHWHWAGGVSELKRFFRNSIQLWRDDTFKKYNYCCDITGKSNDIIIHHLYNYADIINETFAECNLDIRQQIGDYTNEEIKMLEEKCLELHYKYGLGVCLSENVHKKFHSIYGNVNNTLEQYNEFKANVLNGSIII